MCFIKRLRYNITKPLDCQHFYHKICSKDYSLPSEFSLSLFLSDKLLSFKNRPQPSATIPKTAKKDCHSKSNFAFLGVQQITAAVIF